MELIRVCKGNCEYMVPDFKEKEYLALGYSVLNDDGTVRIHGRPVTLEDYKLRLGELEAENQKLKEALSEANAQLQLERDEYTTLKSAYDTLTSSNDAEGTNSSTAAKKATKTK